MTQEKPTGCGGFATFITGTDTGAGKTFLTALLAQYFTEQELSVCVFKPVQTGSPDPARPEDPIWIEQFLGHAVSWHVSYCFSPPVAPTMADTEQTITLGKIVADFKTLRSQHDVVLVEGAGGLRVPLTQQYDMRDLAQALEIPIIIAARPNLGTINHTLLTVESIKSKALSFMGVVVSGYKAETTDPAELGLNAEFTRLLGDQFLGMIPYFLETPLKTPASQLLPERLKQRLSL